MRNFSLLVSAFSFAVLLGGCQQGGGVGLSGASPAVQSQDAAAVLQNGRRLVRTDPAEAVRVLSAAPTSDPAVLNDLGVALDLMGRHQEAQEAYREALLLRPGMRSAAANLALSQALGDTRVAAR